MGAPVRKLARVATVTTPEEAEEMIDYYLSKEAFAFDVESVGPHRGTPALAQVTWLSMATEGRRADVIPLGHPHGELVAAAHVERERFVDPDVLTPKTKKPKVQWRSVDIPARWTPKPLQLKPSVFWKIAEPLFMNDQIFKTAHNALYDLGAVAKYLPDKPPPPYDDTMGMAHLIDENARKGLKPLVQHGNRLPTDNPRHFPGYGHDYDKENVGKRVEAFSFSKVGKYAALDAQYCWWLREDLLPILQQDEAALACYEDEMRLYEYLLDMHLIGQPVDGSEIRSIAERFTKDLHEAEKEVYREAGEVFNVNSSQQLSRILFDQRGNKVEETTPSGNPSTAKGVLEEMDDPLTDRVLEYREFAKLTGTYLGEVQPDGTLEGGLQRFIVDGRIHTELRPFGTVTGRFSSADPNLQNIPRRGDHAKLLRQIFVAPEGYALVVADYSQIEYRVLAHFCKDPTLLAAFEQGYDPHAAVAAQLLNKNIEDVTPEERDLGKTFNFAQIYGAGNAKLAKTLGVSETQIKAFRKKYDDDFPNVGKFSRYVVKTARSRRPTPFVRTLGGRKRHLPALLWSDDGMRAQAERQAVNSLVQGSAADIIKFAMIDVGDMLKDYPDWYMTLTVHDELMLVAPEDEAPECAAMLQKTMEAVDVIDVPLEAEAAYGRTWNDAK